MLRPNLRFLVPLTLAPLAVVLETSPSRACTCGTNVVQIVPAEGATDVPLNVAPWVRGRGDVQLLDADGNVVELEEEWHTPRVTLCIHTRELRPATPLLPNTTYRMVLDDETQSSFTTGETPITASEWDSIELKSQAYLTNWSSSCTESETQICIDSGIRDDLIDVRVFAGDEQTIHYVDFASNLRTIELRGESTCLEVRSRNLAGETSPPARTCFDLTTVPILSYEVPQVGIYPDCDASNFEDFLRPREEASSTDDADFSGESNHSDETDASDESDTSDQSDTANQADDSDNTNDGSNTSDTSDDVSDATAVNTDEEEPEGDNHAVTKPIPRQVGGCSLARTSARSRQVPALSAVLLLLGFTLVARRK